MTPNRTVEANHQPDSSPQRSDRRKSLVRLFALAGVIGVGLGAIHFLSMVSSDYSSTALTDALFNTGFGVLLFVCSRLLVKGSRLIVPVWCGAVLSSIVYSFAVGRGFNWVFAAAGLFILWQLIKLGQDSGST